MGKSVVSQNALAELHDPMLRMLKVSFVWLKPTCDTRVIHFDYTLEQIYHGQKRNVHLNMRNLEQIVHQNRGKNG